MIDNEIKLKWASGQPVINGWLSIANPFTAEILAAQQFDSLTVDMQHGVIEYRDAVLMFQAMRASGVVPVARVPWLEPGIIMKTLDAGALGLICPMVNNRRQAEELVSYAKYPPLGERSFGPTRANFSAGSDYVSEANEKIVCMAMVETAEAMNNLDEIVSTPGLDGVYIGPGDLTLSLSKGQILPRFDSDDPEFVATLKRIQSASEEAGIGAGLHCAGPDYAAKAIGWGFDLVTIGSDAKMLASAAAARTGRIRGLLDGESAATTQESVGAY